MNNVSRYKIARDRPLTRSRPSMRGTPTIAAFVLVSLAIAPSGAFAAATSPAANVPAPITIDACAFGNETSADHPRIGFGVSFTNTSEKVVTDVRFRFAFMSKFNEPLMSSVVTDTGVFSPNVLIDHRKLSVAKQFLASDKPVAIYHWGGDNTSNQPPDSMKMSCTVDAVSFQDGSVYRPAAPADTAMQPKNAAPIRKNDASATKKDVALGTAAIPGNRHHTSVKLGRTYAPIPESAVPDAVLREFESRFTRNGDILVGVGACESGAQFKGLTGWFAAEPPLADLDKANDITAKAYYEYKVKFYRSRPNQDWGPIDFDFDANDGSPFQSTYVQRGGAPVVRSSGSSCL